MCASSFSTCLKRDQQIPKTLAPQEELLLKMVLNRSVYSISTGLKTDDPGQALKALLVSRDQLPKGEVATVGF